MQFLVIGEAVESGPLLPLEQVVPLVEQRVIPSLEMWDKWEAEGRAKGGLFPGERKGAGILEAASPEEINQLLTSLPFWGLNKWEVNVLQSWRSGIESAQRGMDQLKAQM